jgi:uncharacterized protein (TIRG00374 family)
MLSKKVISFGFIFMAVMFFLLLRNIDWQKLFNAFTQFHIIWILPALGIYLIGYIIRGFRWVVLLSPVKKCNFNSLFPILIIGFMANNLLPARAGEFVRAYLNGTKEKISRSASLATIVLERIFDGLTMLILLWASLTFGNLPIQEDKLDARIQMAIHACPYVFGIAFFILFILLLMRAKAIIVISFFTSLLPVRIRKPLDKIAQTFIDGLKILQNAKESILVLIASLAAWTCEFTSYYFLAIGMGIAPSPLTFWSAALLMAVVNIAILVPNAPGGFGLFEFVGVILLAPFGISKELALSFLLLVHIPIVWLPINLMGLYYMGREHLSLQKLGKSRQEELNPKRKKV